MIYSAKEDHHGFVEPNQEAEAQVLARLYNLLLLGYSVTNWKIRWDEVRLTDLFKASYCLTHWELLI